MAWPWASVACVTIQAPLVVSPFKLHLLVPPSMQGISGAIRAYLQLHDRPAGGSAEDEEALLAGMTPEEQKK